MGSATYIDRLEKLSWNIMQPHLRLTHYNIMSNKEPLLEAVMQTKARDGMLDNTMWHYKFHLTVVKLIPAFNVDLTCNILDSIHCCCHIIKES